jgi:hypothetical protein
MKDLSFRHDYGAAAETAAGFPGQSGGAFVSGYAIRAIILAFVPENRRAVPARAVVMGGGGAALPLTGGGG